MCRVATLPKLNILEVLLRIVVSRVRWAPTYSESLVFLETMSLPNQGSQHGNLTELVNSRPLGADPGAFPSAGHPDMRGAA